MALAYAPVLLFLPILLVVGLVFVVVPGGFLVVLGGLYFMLVEIIGLAGRAAWARRRAGRKERRARDRLVRGPIADRSASPRVGALGATAMTAVLRSDQVSPPPITE